MCHDRAKPPTDRSTSPMSSRLAPWYTTTCQRRATGSTALLPSFGDKYQNTDATIREQNVRLRKAARRGSCTSGLHMGRAP